VAAFPSVRAGPIPGRPTAGTAARVICATVASTCGSTLAFCRLRSRSGPGIAVKYPWPSTRRAPLAAIKSGSHVLTGRW